MLIRDLNLSLQAGSVLSLEGPNGPGETSLLRLIAGFLRPAAGSNRLWANGAKVLAEDDRGRHIGWLGHQDAVKPQMTDAFT